MRSFFFVALLTWPATAAATEVVLRYDVADDCPNAEQFRAGVDGRTGEAEWVTEGPEATVLHVRVERSDQGIHGRLVVHEPVGSPSAPREVRDGTCEIVIDALALVAALALDPNASISVTPRPADIEPEPPPPEPRRPPPVPPAVAPTTEAPWRFGLGALAGVASGLGAGTAQLTPLFVDLRRTQADWLPSARLAFSFMPPTEVESALGTARASRFAGQLSACPVGLELDRWWLAPCLGVELGVFRAEGLVVEAPRISEHPWAAAWLAGRSRVRLFGPLSLESELVVAVPITRPRLVVEPRGVIAEISPALALFSAGLFIELP